jgi:hypothetical protein
LIENACGRGPRLVSLKKTRRPATRLRDERHVRAVMTTETRWPATRTDVARGAAACGPAPNARAGTPTADANTIVSDTSPAVTTPTRNGELHAMERRRKRSILFRLRLTNAMGITAKSRATPTGRNVLRSRLR